MIRATRLDMIANQMMKGSSQARESRNSEATEAFKKRYHNTLKYLDDALPKSISAGVCGAIGKAVLWYGKEKMDPFVEAFAKRDYKGKKDPVHVLWEWLLRNGQGRKHNARDIYRRTVTAIRAWVRNAEYARTNLVAAGDDIFEWDAEYKNMIAPKRNQFGLSSKDKKLAEEAIWEEIDNKLRNDYLNSGQ